MKKEIDLDKHKAMFQSFVEKKRTAILSFVDEDGKPFSSIAPFVKKDNKLYVYISQIAEHHDLADKSEWVDVLLVGDESETKNAFATERLRFTCKPKNLDNDDNEEIFEVFNEVFQPSLMNLLRGLDFSLFELAPHEGRYVVGFGLAFDVTIDGSMFNHVVIDKKK